jgi:hypothetical protein
MRGYKFLRLMSHKVTLRSYGYFLHFLHFIFGGKWFLQLCPKLPSFVEKPQGILGVKSEYSITMSFHDYDGMYPSQRIWPNKESRPNPMLTRPKHNSREPCRLKANQTNPKDKEQTSKTITKPRFNIIYTKKIFHERKCTPQLDSFNF